MIQGQEKVITYSIDFQIELFKTHTQKTHKIMHIFKSQLYLADDT